MLVFVALLGIVAAIGLALVVLMATWPLEPARDPQALIDSPKAVLDPVVDETLWASSEWGRLGFQPLANVTLPQTAGAGLYVPIQKTVLRSPDEQAVADVRTTDSGPAEAVVLTAWPSGSYVLTKVPGSSPFGSRSTSQAVAQNARTPAEAWEKHRHEVALQTGRWGSPNRIGTLADAVAAFRTIKPVTAAIRRRSTVELVASFVVVWVCVGYLLLRPF